MFFLLVGSWRSPRSRDCRNSLKLVLGVAGTPFFYSQVSAIQDQVAGGAAVRTPAEAAVERAGVRTGRGGGRRARRQAGRLLAQVRMGETAARVASARADGDREGGGVDCGFGEGPGRAGWVGTGWGFGEGPGRVGCAPKPRGRTIPQARRAINFTELKREKSN